MLPFLQSNTNSSSATTAKLQIELAAIVDCGERFVKTMYELEGDGPLVLRCYEVISILNASIHTSHFPNLTAVVAEKIGPASCVQQFIHYGKLCVTPGGLFYYQVWE